MFGIKDDECGTSEELPLGVLVEVLRHLSHRDLTRAAGTSKALAAAARHPDLWTSLSPSIPPGWIFERRPLVLGWASTLARRASRLQHLDLSGLATHVGDEQLGTFLANASGLLTCNLSYTSITDHALEQLAAYCPSLVELRLEGCDYISQAGLRAAAGACPLQVLVLAHCRWLGSNTDEHALEFVRACATLTHLDVDGWEHLRDDACQALVGCSGLTRLCLDGAGLGDEAMRACARFLPRLQELSVSFGESISEQGALCIRELCGLTSLRLRKCTRLPDAALARMLQGLHLRRLDLTECHGLGGLSAEALAVSSGSSLVSVCLAWCWHLSDAHLHQVGSPGTYTHHH